MRPTDLSVIMAAALRVDRDRVDLVLRRLREAGALPRERAADYGPREAAVLLLSFLSVASDGLNASYAAAADAARRLADLPGPAGATLGEALEAALNLPSLSPASYVEIRWNGGGAAPATATLRANGQPGEFASPAAAADAPFRRAVRIDGNALSLLAHAAATRSQGDDQTESLDERP